ncbi:MAG: glutamate 5-kinase [Bacteroidales bacterium]
MDSWSKLTDSKKIVIKVGSSTLSYPNGRLNYQRLVRLAEVMAGIQKTGKKLILVSSGAIAVGAGRLGLGCKPTDLADKQALAAVGQAELIRLYQKFFGTMDQQVAQVLLTKDILVKEERRFNAGNTLDELLSMDIIPIINENDTVATDEIEFGDNDTLSAHVAVLAEADLLILLSDIDGLFSADPRQDPDALIIPEVFEITDNLVSSAAGPGSGFGTGGMATKIEASRICSDFGIKVVITNGAKPEILLDILAGKRSGTLFSWKTRNELHKTN